MAQAALEAGKHVICEKPLATTLDDARALAALAASTGLVATVPSSTATTRWSARRVHASRRVNGPLHLIHGSYLQDWLLDPASNNWRVDPALGGASRVFADIGSHWCDLVEWVSGERFTEASAAFATVIAERSATTGQSFSTPATGGARQAVESEDVAAAMFRTGAGTLASLTVSRSRPDATTGSGSRSMAPMRAWRSTGRMPSGCGSAGPSSARKSSCAARVRQCRTTPVVAAASGACPGLRPLLRSVRRRHLSCR